MNGHLEAAILRRIVVGHVAEAMLDGSYETRKWAWSIATELSRGGVDIAAEAWERIAGLGGHPSKVWVVPAQVGGEDQEKALRAELARHIAGAYVSGSDEQVHRARELETALDGLGVNVDNQVDSLVLEQMRIPPSRRGTAGRADDCPF